ncbi:MAG: PPC domain-containing protein [Deltaproteobacteria bacterium]|nr:PPC domain-containing protein [Deltaproteobacteria bacterium]MDQ3301330.1 PPC domain-containing protein [Myxococcota bacterium]
MRTHAATRLAIFGLLALGAGVGCTGDDFEVTPIYNHANGRVVVQLSRGLASDEQLFVQARRGKFGTLDCTQLAQTIPAVADTAGNDIDGPLVDSKLTKSFYGPEWGHGNPTAEMLASLAAGTDSIIDVCIMNGAKIVAQIERDLFQAWDQARKQGIGGKADDPSGEVRINSPQEYGVRCVAELGEIPFFEKTGENEYSTYDCLESTPIPMTVTAADGTVKAPSEGTEAKCDAPQFIYDLCEAGPRVASRTNDQGTRWVLLCRKSKANAEGAQGYASDQFNDIAMVGHNPFTGKTCFFQNALYSKTDGGNIPHPADQEKSVNLWSGVHGGEGSGIQCANCHDADPFIHTPWIDGAKDQAGRPIVPKMGIDPDLALGALDTPYALVNLKGQGWKMPKQLVSTEANACLKCHRMGDGRWSDSWIERLEGTDTSWKNITTDKYNAPEHKYWMPTDVLFTTDAQWDASDSKKALDFLQTCADAPTTPGCVWRDIPSTLGGAEGGGRLRNPVALSDVELSKQATTILGMNKAAPTQVCAECHAPNQTTLREWQEKTDTALETCLKDSDAGVEVSLDRQRTVAKDEFKTVGEFVVAPGASISVTMTGDGDGDLYIKRGAEVTDEIYDCRPFARSSEEACLPGQFNANGPATFYVGVKGFAERSVLKLRIKYKEPSPDATPAKDVVSCLKLDPTRADSPYTPGKLGIYSAAAHLGFFQDLFKQAFPADQDGNTADTWALEYGKFKGRVSMPKGNHPRFSQGELDIVAEWFARGLPRLTDHIAPDTGPTTCAQTINPAVATHATQMAASGWGAANRTAGMNMYGCTSADPRACMSTLPTAQSKAYGAGWAKVGNLRILRELAFNTFFWMRSSPDGRFVANGATGGDGAVISDLQTNKDIRVQAAYDPGFFPDGRGWMFQGTPVGTGFCTNALLVSNPDRINFSESQCSSVDGIPLYQHMGQGLGGGDYFTVNGQFTSDNAGGTVTRDPSAGFGNTAKMKLTPMVFDGTRYVAKPQITTNSPYEGDIVLSPSTKLALSRFGNETGQLGYVLRRINATSNGPSYDVTTTELGRYCTKGAKPSISFDEKWFVTHHYVGPNDFAEYGYASASDPAFQAKLMKGTADIILVNLVTGARTRVTTMKAGQYALFPHFRSDGWFYFLVRDGESDKEYAVASDAALTL